MTTRIKTLFSLLQKAGVNDVCIPQIKYEKHPLVQKYYSKLPARYDVLKISEDAIYLKNEPYEDDYGRLVLAYGSHKLEWNSEFVEAILTELLIDCYLQEKIRKYNLASAKRYQKALVKMKENSKLKVKELLNGT